MHNIGDIKKTYEVIADTGCNSYSLERVPAYKLTMIGLREGTAGMAANTSKPYVSTKTKSGKAVHQPTPSIMGVYRKAVRQTSVVRDFNERRRSRASIDQSDQAALVTARQDAVAATVGNNNEVGEAFKFQDEPKLQMQGVPRIEFENEDLEEVEGDAFGTGLGHSKYFDEYFNEQEDDDDDDYDYEAQSTDMQDHHYHAMGDNPRHHEEDAEV